MPARVGHNGFSASRHEGDGTTPAGTFGFVYGFGSLPDPGMHGFSYRPPAAQLVLVGVEGRLQPLGHPPLHQG